ncbi:MAG: signal peptidase I [Pirellulales bacterium]
MGRSKKKKTHRETTPAATTVSPAHVSQSARNVRETIESIVIAFVLAFLFRTFEAEAFVIPTGSMAPTLRGRNKDVDCPECGYRFQASASVEVDDQGGLPRDAMAGRKVVTATCPMCRRTISVADKPSYNGDRILVNKFIYEFQEPNRWDVIVFHFPGDAKMNYIKRLVGLPNEVVRIERGDIFVKPQGEDRFTIVRKPLFKLWAILQSVHDTRYQPKVLADKNWPLRWQVWPSDQTGGAAAWQSRIIESSDLDISQEFSTDGSSPNTQWIRYRHLVPSQRDWQQLARGPLAPDAVAAIRPKLITDFYGYNTSMTRDQGRIVPPQKLGLHWVGDLMVQCDVDVKSDQGDLILDLVEAGKHFECRIDVATGDATLSIEGLIGFAPRAKTAIHSPGHYHVAFANIDDQLQLWVDESLASFDAPTTYDVTQVYEDRDWMEPVERPQEGGDLAPAGIGSRGLAADVTRIEVMRDIYYIADKGGPGQPITDFDLRTDRIYGRDDLATPDYLWDSRLWDIFRRRQHVDFVMKEDQFFVLGDNSPYSKDGRLWHQDQFGHYVERQLLIGKALFVYWPHSWNQVPGTSIPFPFFPNFGDMGLVR